MVELQTGAWPDSWNLPANPSAHWNQSINQPIYTYCHGNVNIHWDNLGNDLSWCYYLHPFPLHEALNLITANIINNKLCVDLRD